MPRGRSNVTAVQAAEPVKPAEPELVELDEAEEPMEEEEVEYEEIEEEVEEEVEEVIEEEGSEEDEEKAPAINGSGADASADDDTKMKDEDVMEEDEREKHVALLTLPPHGSEVYVGGLPPDASEEELKSFCETVGEVTEVRMMKGKESSDNKGYAFVTFRTKELAEKAIKDLNSTEFKGKKVKCSASQAKHKLFIGNIPRSWVEEDLRNTVEKLGPGVTDVHLMKDTQDPSRNRGFAFIEYYNHACAEYSRKKMSTPKFKLDSNAPTVSWADPKSGDSSNSQVKALYVKNLPKNITQDQLKKLFEHHGDITKVVLPPAKIGQEHRYGFVHFKERASAMKALKNTERYEIDGQVLECSLAKPQVDKSEVGPNAQKGPLLPNYPLGYGMVGGAYGALPTGFPHPMVYGRGATPGVAMVPMILPDGRFGYVLQQQPGAPVATQQRTGGRSGNSSSGRQNNNSNGGRRFHPY